MKQRIITGVLAGVMLIAPGAEAAIFEGAEVVQSGFRSLYSPSVVTFQGVKRMWLGGWLTEADLTNYVVPVYHQGVPPSSVDGPDKIFYSEFNGSSWGWPVLVFRKMGYHVNDPTVLNPPSTDGIDRSAWLYMYYTALSNDDAVAGRWDRHVIGFASSIDGGRSWTDHGFVIGQNNGLDGTGAWSPSAIGNGTEIWIYYHTNGPGTRVLRTRLRANGFEPIATEHAQVPAVVSNVDVSRQGSVFVLTANTLDLKNVVRYVSGDGLNWSTASYDSNPIIAGGSASVLTPHVETIDVNRYFLYFGWDPDDTGSHSVHRWQFRNQ